MSHADPIISGLKNGLLVSCQEPEGSPLDRPGFIAALASVAEKCGAVGVRVNGIRNIRATCAKVRIPVVGLEKLGRGEVPVYITPTLASASRVAEAGATIVALDCTSRQRPGNETIGDIIANLKKKSRALIMADISTVEEGIAAADMGADIVATTLYGYTGGRRQYHKPAFTLLRKLVERVSVPVILEGRVHTPADLRKGFELGAHAVVVGTAISDFAWLASTFIAAAPRQNQPRSHADRQPKTSRPLRSKKRDSA